MSRHSARGRDWDVFRRIMKRRVNYQCEKCGNGGRLEVHHIVKMADGGAKYDPDNIKVLCRKCHFAEHRGDKPRQNPVRREWWRTIEAL